MNPSDQDLEEFIGRLDKGIHVTSLTDLISRCDHFIRDGVLPAEFAAIAYLLYRIQAQWKDAILSAGETEPIQKLIRECVSRIIRSANSGNAASARTDLYFLAQELFQKHIVPKRPPFKV